jgi:hypothetical protein
MRAKHLMRRYALWGTVVSFALLALGLVFALGSAIAAGDWMLAQRPWIEIGLRLLTAGLAGGAFFGLLRVFVEPVGWWRLAAIPSGIVVVAFWLWFLIVGLPRSGPGGGGETDVVVILYTVPEYIAGLVFANLAIAAIPPVARWWRGGTLTDDDETRAPADL